MDKKIKIVRQVVEVMTPDKGVTRSIPMYYLYMWYADEWCFLHLMREDDCDNLSVFIAEGLIDFGVDDFFINHSYVDYDCECCGVFTDEYTTISNKENNKTIEILRDDHLGDGTRGFSNDDVISDWKTLGYDLEIIDYEE